MATLKKLYKQLFPFLGYFFAVGTVALATWAKILAEPKVIPADVPILYIVAILLTATFYGLWPSILCSLLSLLAFSYYFMPPVYSFTFNLEQVPISIVFLLVGLLISYLSSNLRKKTLEANKEIAIRQQTESELIAYRENLENLVKQRTADLEQTNLDLTQEIKERKNVEESLRDSELRYRIVADKTYDFEFWISSEGRFIYASPACERIYGYKSAEFIADPGLRRRVIHPDDLEKFDRHIDEEAGKNHGEIECRIIRSDGTQRWVGHNCQPIYDGQGRYIGVRGSNRDITVRKQAEEELRKAQLGLEIRIKERTRELAQVNMSLESERRRFNDVLESLPVYVILLSQDYHVPFANRFFRERFGESNGKRCYEYLFGRSEPCEKCETYTVFKTNSPHHWEWVGPDHHSYDIFDFPFTDVDGSPLIMEVGIDVTEQMKAQAALLKARNELETTVAERTREYRETRDYLDNLFNYANAPIIVWDPQFKIVRFNHAFERLTGRTADEVLGKTLDILFPADSHDHSMKHILEATSGERWEVVEIPIVHKDGPVRILLWNSANIYAQDNKRVIATVAQGQDITERKKAEQLKDEFISLVSHELRTPMTVITGSLRTAIAKGISPKDKQILIENAIEGSNSLSAILENLLELSRYQAGRLQIHMEKVNLPAIVHKVAGILETGIEGHRFIMNFPDDLPLVEADPIRVERILYNLMENAMKYSPEETEIKVFAKQEKENMVIGVADKGIGISKENQSRVFELFERLGTESRIQGLGLGLVVCKRLVEAQKGQIWLESELQKGSTFYFTLPVSNKTV